MTGLPALHLRCTCVAPALLHATSQSGRDADGWGSAPLASTPQRPRRLSGGFDGELFEVVSRAADPIDEAGVDGRRKTHQRRGTR